MGVLYCYTVTILSCPVLSYTNIIYMMVLEHDLTADYVWNLSLDAYVQYFPLYGVLKFFIIANGATRALATWPQRCLLIKTFANNTGLFEKRVSTIARTPH
jgi:hypothetical protein